jgi:hypothetical protein
MALRVVPLKKLIRHKTTLKFFASGKWVDDVDLAQSFEDYHVAVKAKQQYQLTDVELYYVFHDHINEYLDWTISL